MQEEIIIVWFRNDLRIHDHKPLLTAISRAKYIIPIYVIDPRHFEETQYGFTKTGNIRLRFLYECIIDLRDQLKKIGGNLVIRFGHPEDILPQIAIETGANSIYYHEEATFEELQVETKLHDRLLKCRISWDTWWESTLCKKDDLPFTISHFPKVFTQFRSAIEKQVVFAEPEKAPNAIKLPPNLFLGEWPTDLIPKITKDQRAAFDFHGGESSALQRLDEYIWQKDALKNYANTRNELIGGNYSSKFSPWLALGCLSPRLIHIEVKHYEVKRIRNKSTYWLIFELFWRDFFRFTALKIGRQLFALKGVENKTVKSDFDEIRYEKWKLGQTGIPFIDANMRELLTTGFMSNRGRQNVASFFVHDLGIDWRAGATWFESQLIDYDPCSNWGNWAYIAGVGNDPRSNRYFNIPSQSERYDHNGHFIQLWCPELVKVPVRYLHHLQEYSSGFLAELGLVIGKDYPAPITNLISAIRQ